MSWQEDPQDCLWQGLTTKAQVPQFVYDDLGNFKGLLGEAHVPLVASGRLGHVKCMVADCCLGQRRVMVSSGVHQGNPLLMQLLLRPAQVLPEDSPANGVLVVLVNEPHPLGMDFFF